MTFRSSLVAYLRSRRGPRMLYGAVVGLALVAGLEDHPPDPGVMAATLMATAVAIGLAELYSELVGRELRTGKLGLGPGGAGGLAAEVLATMAGAAFPAVFFVLAGLGVLSTPTAFDVAKWSGVGLLVGSGFAAGRLAGATIRSSLVHAVAVGSIGAALIAFKALLH